MTWQDKYQAWKTFPTLEDELKTELTGNTEADAESRFYRDLAFGTGGLRGVLGAGTNRMNIYTVAKATRGLARYLRKKAEQPSCAIAYDSRNKSERFAHVAAAVLAHQGVKVHIYRELMPTPMLSFAVRNLGCDGGIVITASHNPAKYNGYKVYGADGCQITLEAAEEIQGFIAEVADLSDEAIVDFDKYLAAGQIAWIGGDTIEAYYQATQACSMLAPSVPLDVVYSPLNGAGNKPVREILRRIGNVRVQVVPEQELPDGNFPTCSYPNPEEKEAMALASALAQSSEADFCLATDPDCDRVGVGVPTKDGVRLINGNEMGALLLDFVCAQRIAQGTMPENPVAIKTIVTTEMASVIAEKYGVKLLNVLTGFKFIGEEIGRLEKAGEEGRFLFGFEESYGYLSGTAVRDKDAVNASMLICEMAAYYKAQGKTLLEALEKLYATYGYYQDRLLSFTFEGISGMAQMQGIMQSLRKPMDAFAGATIGRKVDYLTMDTGLPKSDVIAFHFEDGSRVIVRPSGTEPKLKIYVSVVADTPAESGTRLDAMCEKLSKWIEETT